MAMYSWFTHGKFWFSVVMLVCQRVWYITPKKTTLPLLSPITKARPRTESPRPLRSPWAIQLSFGESRRTPHVFFDIYYNNLNIKILEWKFWHLLIHTDDHVNDNIDNNRAGSDDNYSYHYHVCWQIYSNSSCNTENSDDNWSVLKW